MGSVVVCTDKVLERHVAIKFIKSAANKHRMNDEVAALLKLRSKHVVQVYDVLRVGPEEVGIVQEFINGKDLFESYGAPSSVTDYYRQLWQIASGIADIHELGVIHRDIKPNNMKTDHEGVIKIFDFGLARDDGPNAATKCFVGTPGFAAPELYKKPFVFTPAVDTYAFGVTALYLATGTLPPELREAPPSIDIAGYFTALDFTIAPEIAEILDACIQECPLDRPTMREVRDNLARHLLFDKHRALVVYQGEASVLSSASREVNLAFGGIGSVSIRYNGLNFLVENVSGEVHINNQALAAGSALPGACVVALGAAHRRPNERRFITFDISHPEIVL
ncbi:serine/threonine-protein kinase [Methyloversatilis discipulorum]|uniref:serine/threonine-protein kinase n=1 Tax=Methyloversatilis discipulorum TaxID=1119528 RepID=UPI001A488951|nr:serine/threonine-protein kinase [Methyloversatilis discipulorum]MBL8467254.1 serine/threonine protein kinase [Methyloversatilis discipulorum]